jgi:hypothetical protein
MEHVYSDVELLQTHVCRINTLLFSNLEAIIELRVTCIRRLETPHTTSANDQRTSGASAITTTAQLVITMSY